MYLKSLNFKFFLSIITVFVVKQSFTQELVFETSLNLKSGLKDKSDILPIVLEDKRCVLFFLDNIEIKSLVLSKDFQKIDEYRISRPQIPYNKLLGHSINDNDYCLFFSNNKKNQFYTQSINISEKSSQSQTLSLKLKKEKYLEAISYKGRFYLLTVKKFSSILKIYEFMGSRLIAEKELDFSQHKFSNEDYPDLYSTLSQSATLTQQKLSITKIDTENPIPLEIAAQKSKLYLKGNDIYLTIDNSLRNTKIVKINLDSYEYSFKEIDQAQLDCGDALNVVSNSFLLEDKLFQVKSCKSGLLMRISDIKTHQVISEYSVNKNEEIQFKNGSIRQEGGTNIYTQGTDKELDKTKQILRKISNSKIGVSAYQRNNNLTVTIGGYKEVQQATGGGMTFTPGSSISTPYGNVSTPATYSYNPTMFGYGSYKNTRAIYFKSILDSSKFEHIEEAKVTKTAYDKIKDFEESIMTSISNETLFRFDKSYIFGYYSRVRKTYTLSKFSDGK